MKIKQITTTDMEGKQMTEELKPCWCCGNPAEYLSQSKRIAGCWDNNNPFGRESCPNNGRAMDVETWNTRPVEDALRERVKRLEEELAAIRWEFSHFTA